MSLLWRTAIVAVVIFVTVLVAIGIIAVLPRSRGGVLEKPPAQAAAATGRHADSQHHRILDAELAVMLRTPGTGEKP